ncbi:conserved hypothetical protein [Coccidioides posadasii str. Silveira]|uniref:Uncharacterized protein n=1 Tax=Coccidioides posadasii (strain RMSCC 757 / Silveira) TaxID=443226 RepID=E9CZI4_COCPS|nr:conserved hypothetical protein [Coccidioides posadasii str. Silveira]
MHFMGHSEITRPGIIPFLGSRRAVKEKGFFVAGWKLAFYSASPKASKRVLSSQNGQRLCTPPYSLDGQGLAPGEYGPVRCTEDRPTLVP